MKEGKTNGKEKDFGKHQPKNEAARGKILLAVDGVCGRQMALVSPMISVRPVLLIRCTRPPLRCHVVHCVAVKPAPQRPDHYDSEGEKCFTR